MVREVTPKRSPIAANAESSVSYRRCASVDLRGRESLRSH